jgi:uncharacterized protein (DUF1330 family)
LGYEMTKGVIIGLIKFTHKAAFMNDFAAKVPNVIAKYGGKFVLRQPKTHYSEGQTYDLHVVSEFEDIEDAKKMLNSEEWNAVNEHRRKNSDLESGSFMLLEGGDALAPN